MPGPTRITAILRCLCAAALLLGACATSGGQKPAQPNPIDMQRGWKVYSYTAGQALVGVTTIPQHPADTTPPNEILDSISEAFCTPVGDPKNTAADATLRDFCQRAAGVKTRVVLSPGWKDELPLTKVCFIHCVCEGRAPRSEAPGEAAREAETGPCTNRLNCRLDCPQP